MSGVVEFSDAILQSRPAVASSFTFRPAGGDCEAERCRQMWCAVLVGEIRVMLGRGSFGDRQTHAQARRDLAAARALDWIGTAGFRTVCWLAGYDPEILAPGLKRALENPERTIELMEARA